VPGAFRIIDILSELSDVFVSNPQPNQILAWNGSKWVNTDSSSLEGTSGLSGLSGIAIGGGLQYIEYLTISSKKNLVELL
jgi:hypothetical protein